MLKPSSQYAFEKYTFFEFQKFCLHFQLFVYKKLKNCIVLKQILALPTCFLRVHLFQWKCNEIIYHSLSKVKAPFLIKAISIFFVYTNWFCRVNIYSAAAPLLTSLTSFVFLWMEGAIFDEKNLCVMKDVRIRARSKPEILRFRFSILDYFQLRFLPVL